MFARSLRGRVGRPDGQVLSSPFTIVALILALFLAPVELRSLQIAVLSAGVTVMTVVACAGSCPRA